MTGPPIDGLAGWQLRRLAEIGEGDLSKLDVAHLASQSELSPFHFSRAFKHSTGETPGAWLTRLRMERAERLLRDGRMSVAQVAQSVGYSGTAPFTRAFRSRFGVTPREHLRR